MFAREYGADVYRVMAAVRYQIEYRRVTRSQRQAIKNEMFLGVYSAGDAQLGQSLGDILRSAIPQVSGRFQGRNPNPSNIPRGLDVPGFRPRQVQREVMTNVNNYFVQADAAAIEEMLSAETLREWRAPVDERTRRAAFMGVPVHIGMDLAKDDDRAYAVVMDKQGRVSDAVRIDFSERHAEKKKEDARRRALFAPFLGGVIRGRFAPTDYWRAEKDAKHYAAKYAHFVGREFLFNVCAGMDKNAEPGIVLKFALRYPDYPPMFSFRDIEIIGERGSADIALEKKRLYPRRKVSLED